MLRNLLLDITGHIDFRLVRTARPRLRDLSPDFTSRNSIAHRLFIESSASSTALQTILKCLPGLAIFTESKMDTTTLLIIILLVLVLGGGGFYGRGRWF